MDLVVKWLYPINVYSQIFATTFIGGPDVEVSGALSSSLRKRENQPKPRLEKKDTDKGEQGRGRTGKRLRASE